MTVLVIGSIALDTLETPFGKVEDELGGAGSYFSFAARVLTPVQLVGVGIDFTFVATSATTMTVTSGGTAVYTLLLTAPA